MDIFIIIIIDIVGLTLTGVLIYKMLTDYGNYGVLWTTKKHKEKCDNKYLQNFKKQVYIVDIKMNLIVYGRSTERIKRFMNGATTPTYGSLARKKEANI